jgi:hypothetical protein
MVFSGGAPLAAQQPAPPPAATPLQPLSPDQLDNLVSPIALYPDGLLSQVLVASTYPLELVEAGQWLRQNPNQQGAQLVDAARQQNWDPSIQALVVFPDVIDRLTSDIRWTTDLGDAFLAQQADVMNAVQRLRAEARASGRLASNTEETVATDTEGGETAIDIQPTNPNVVYVPDYNPEYIWGPPNYGYYPDLYYPDAFGFSFWPGIDIGGFFGGLGWGGWGWGPNWFNCSIFENGYFFNHYGFRGFGGRGFDGRGFEGRGFDGRATWAHNPEHRLGVAYPNRTVASRFGGNFGGRGNFRGSTSAFGHVNPGANGSFGNRGNFGQGTQARGSQFGGRFGNPGSQASSRTSPAYGGSRAYRSTPSYSRNHGGGSTPAYRSSGSFGGQAFRSNPSYSRGYSGARSMPAYRSSPSFGGNAFRSSPSFGGGRSGGGSSRSFSGGGGFHGGGGGGGGFHGGGGGHGGGRR